MVFDKPKIQIVSPTKQHFIITKYMNFLIRIKEKHSTGKLTTIEYNSYKNKCMAKLTALQK